VCRSVILLISKALGSGSEVRCVWSELGGLHARTSTPGPASRGTRDVGAGTIPEKEGGAYPDV
jgi:hypothetical protein